MTAFVETFGKFDSDGNKYVKLEDARTIYLEGQIPDDFVAKPWGSVSLVFDAVRALGNEPQDPDEIWYSNQGWMDIIKFYFGYGEQAAQAKIALNKLSSIYREVYLSIQNFEDIELLGKINYLGKKIYYGYKNPCIFANRSEIELYNLDKVGMIESLIESTKIFQKIGLQSLAHRDFQYSLDESMIALGQLRKSASTNKVSHELTILREEILNNCIAYLSDDALDSVKPNECPFIQKNVRNNMRDTSNNPWTKNSGRHSFKVKIFI